MLTMTAGPFVRTSPPTDGSKLTHQTSPRFMHHVRDGRLSPFVNFRLSSLVGTHIPIGGHEIARDDVRADQRLDEPAGLVSTPRSATFAAAMQTNGISKIATFDAGFERISGVRRAKLD